MLTLRPLLRQTRQRSWALSRNFVRVQHNSYGPHKEYFQNPNQPYYPDLQTPNRTHPDYNTHNAGPKSSRTRRFIRATLWMVVFFNLGALTAEAMLTWDYLQPPFETGSEEEEEYQDEINELLDTCSLVESLREDGWKEEPVFTRQTDQAASGSEHLLHQTLQSTQGITMKLFRHPSEHFTTLVFFPGFGCEGWPDVVHGGVTSSMIFEATQKHVEGSPKYKSLGLYQASIDFRAPVKPGAVYAVLCLPAQVKAGVSWQTDSHQMYHVMDIQLLQLNLAPRMDIRTDPITGTRYAKVNFPTTSGDGELLPTFATATVVHEVVPLDDKVLEVNELVTAYTGIKRLAEELLTPTENVEEVGVDRDVLNQFGAAMQDKIDAEHDSQRSSDADEKSNPNDKSD